MVEQIPEILRRARQKYTNGGLKALVVSGTQFALRDFWLEYFVKKRSISRTELAKIAAAKGRIWYLEKEEPLKIKPLNHPQLEKEFTSYSKQYEPERPFVCELSDCLLVGPYAMGLVEDDRIITETTPVGQKRLAENIDEYLNSPFQLLRGSRRNQPDQRIKCAFPLVMPYDSYYHWIIEYLPKLRLLDYYEEKTDKEPTILIETAPPSYVSETLNIMGYRRDNVKEWQFREAKVETLTIPIHRPHLFNYSKPDLSEYSPSRRDLIWLRNKVQSNTGESDQKNGKKRLYISRQKATSASTGRRKILNYDEISEVLDDFGFESYTLEDMTFMKQVQLFMSADTIMGPHGAGLVNMLFSNDPTVIELFPEGTLKPHFYFLADMMGFDYNPIVTQSENDDLIVDTELLRSRLNSILTRANS